MHQLVQTLPPEEASIILPCEQRHQTREVWVHACMRVCACVHACMWGDNGGTHPIIPVPHIPPKKVEVASCRRECELEENWLARSKIIISKQSFLLSQWSADDVDFLHTWTQCQSWKGPMRACSPTTSWLGPEKHSDWGSSCHVMSQEAYVQKPVL